MASVIHRAPSVGSVVKKIVELHPELTAKEVTEIVRECLEPQGGVANEFSKTEIINEAKALRLALEHLSAFNSIS